MLAAALLLAGWWLIHAFTGGAIAQSPAAPAAAKAPELPIAPVPASGGGGGMPTLYDLFVTSPYLNACTMILSVLAVVTFAYLMLTLTAGSFNPPRFIDDVTKLVLNRQFDQAVHLCQTNAGVFASTIIQRLIENRDKDHAVLMEIILVEGRRRGELIWNRIGYLSEVSNVAPMVGLLGTVTGMIRVFFTLTTRTVGERAGQMAAGVAEAMGTTMFGLVVAIGAALLYTIVRGRAVVVLAETEQVCHSLADHIHRAASDPRLKRIDALAEAARAKISATQERTE